MCGGGGGGNVVQRSIKKQCTLCDNTFCTCNLSSFQEKYAVVSLDAPLVDKTTGKKPARSL